MEEKLRNLTRQLISAPRGTSGERLAASCMTVSCKKLGRHQYRVVSPQCGKFSRHANPKGKIAGIQRLVANVVKVAHRFARELRPAVLDDVGLIPALHALVRA